MAVFDGGEPIRMGSFNDGDSPNESDTEVWVETPTESDNDSVSDETVTSTEQHTESEDTVDTDE